MKDGQLSHRDLIRLAQRFGIGFYPAIDRPLRRRQLHTHIEAHTRHPSVNILPMGAYSYSMSAFGPVARIGRYCSIAPHVEVMGSHHPIERFSTSPVFYNARFRAERGLAADSFAAFDFDNASKPVTIGHDVWIGGNVLLRDGISIGDGAVVAAGSVVTRDVAPYTIVGGAPAKVIRARFDDRTVAEMQDIQWWRYDAADLIGAPDLAPGAFLDHLKRLQDSGQLVPRPEQRHPLIHFLRLIAAEGAEAATAPTLAPTDGGT